MAWAQWATVVATVGRLKELVRCPQRITKGIGAERDLLGTADT
jgi:hypothetical protein